MGSSYFRLLVAEVGDRRPVPAGGGGCEPPVTVDRGGGGALRLLADEKVYVGWGDALTRDGIIPPGDIGKAEAALSELVGKASAAGCSDPVIVGTGTLRRALNGEDARARLEEAASLPITAADAGAKIVEINPNPTPLTVYTDFSFRGNSGEILPLIDMELSQALQH